MFPIARTPLSTRLRRGVDLAVQFATLGEFGGEAVGLERFEGRNAPELPGSAEGAPAGAVALPAGAPGATVAVPAGAVALPLGGGPAIVAAPAGALALPLGAAPATVAPPAGAPQGDARPDTRVRPATAAARRRVQPARSVSTRAAIRMLALAPAPSAAARPRQRAGQAPPRPQPCVAP